MGFIRGYADRMNLAAMTPRGDIASTGHALASDAEILVYAPIGGFLDVDLTGRSGRFSTEWMNPGTGAIIPGKDVVGGGTRTFGAPFGGDAVLYLKALGPTAGAAGP
jgi:hypothetical protein